MIGDRVVIEFTDGTDPLDITTGERRDVSTSPTGVRVLDRYCWVEYPWHRISSVSRWQMYDENGAPLQRGK